MMQARARTMRAHGKPGRIIMSKAPMAPGREKLRSIVPKLIDYTHNVLYNEVWEGPELSKRDRGLITIAAMMAMNRPDYFKVHLGRALGYGVTKEEVGEMITHLAFYCGWPSAMEAGKIAQEVIEGSAPKA
jgi:4-carboxymuconolactone decarboxylase